MKRIAAVLAMLMLAGCNTPTAYLVTTKFIAIEIPPDLYQCQVTAIPDYKTLTDRQVAKLLTALYRDNVTCKTSMDAIKKYVEDAKAAIDK
jgi:hypothetical protein